MLTQLAVTNQALVGLLTRSAEAVRSKSLSMLCESYCSDDGIYDAVKSVWSEKGAESGFPEFPMLSYFAVPSSKVGASVALAREMAAGRKLTDKSARCAGKLIEQLAWLEPTERRPHLSALDEVCGTSKIFFRVPMERWQLLDRMLGMSSDELYEQLESAIAALTADGEDHAARMQGECALDTLRRRFPNTIDIGAAIANAPEEGSGLTSFEVAIKSLVQFPQEGTEETIAKHLHDARESIHATAVEALVRSGTPAAAARLLLAIPDAPSNNRSWIVRGLQRIRAEGLAEEIARVRAQVVDPRLWLMLLIAEIHQLDASGQHRIAFDVQRLAIQSDAVNDALDVYVQLHHIPDSSALSQGIAKYRSQS